MEKVSDSDQILLGYEHRDPFCGPPVASHRNSDVDFRDVFGGPPRRRSSFYETRRSRAESLDSHPSRGRAGGSGDGSAVSWHLASGSGGEKPVFGECGSPARRRELGDDFFSDIFPGSDSLCSSPRKPDRDPLSSSPGSRVLSPIRPLPPRYEPFVGGSSLPAQLSFSTKLAKGIDHPTFNSPTQRSLCQKDVGSPDAFGFSTSPNASIPSLTTRAVPLNDDMRNDAHAFYRQSPLSRQISHCLDTPLRATDSSSSSMEVQSHRNPTSLGGYVSSTQFHFSIYKWAGKGVTLIMPSNTKEKNGSRLRRLPEVVLQGVGVGLSSYNDDMPTVTTDSKSQSENQDREYLKDHIMDKIDDANSTVVEELLPAGLESKFLRNDVTEESGAYNTKSEKIPVTVHEGPKPELKNLHQLFDDGLDKQGNEDIVRQVETEDFSRGGRNVYNDANANQQARRENSINHVELSSPSMQNVQVSLEDKVRGSRAKGKVKEFIKIFNHDTSPKRKGLFDTQKRRSRGKDGINDKVGEQVSASATKTVEEMEASSRISNKSLLDTPTATNQFLKTVENPDNIASSGVHEINESPSERNCTIGPFAESTPEIIDASVCNLGESHCEDLEGCLVEQLSQDQDEHLQSDSHQDQIKASDSKIREWSKGKEGNIRSLLSTLQYVLWPESGWKPVPLVDIIEVTSVKRAYQKALLCLHPDKLQQKGAGSIQKHIAEKVFDILQEAWDHFNSISTF